MLDKRTPAPQKAEPPHDSSKAALQPGAVPSADKAVEEAPELHRLAFEADPFPRLLLSLESGLPHVLCVNAAAEARLAGGGPLEGMPLAALGETGALLVSLTSEAGSIRAVDLLTHAGATTQRFLASAFPVTAGVWSVALVGQGDAVGRLLSRNEELERSNKELEAQALEMAALAASLQSAREVLNDEVTRRVALEGKLRALVETDALSGAASRRHFLQSLAAELRRAHRYGRPTSLVMLDVDHFKGINDSFGHPAGDAVIVAVAQRSEASIRIGVDLVGRLGGEEFAVMLPETDLPGALTVAERLRRELRDLVVVSGGADIRLTASFGAATSGGPYPELSSEGLLREADAALYEAKRGGRDRVVGVSRGPILKSA